MQRRENPASDPTDHHFQHEAFGTLGLHVESNNQLDQMLGFLCADIFSKHLTIMKSALADMSLCKAHG